VASAASDIGCYLLPGTGADPRAALDEAAMAESLGLKGVWIAEKFGLKDLPSLAGAIAATTSRVMIGAGVTHLGFRHPLAIASMSQTLQALSGGRFRIGFGRGAPPKWQAAGITQPTITAFADMAAVLKQLWSGARVCYDGPAGRFPSLRIDVIADLPQPPILMAAIGPKTLEMAARHFDGVILHPFLTPAAVASCVSAVRAARAEAGLPQENFKVIAAVIVGLPAERSRQVRLAQARAARYLGAPSLARALARVNGWDLARLTGLAGTGGREQDGGSAITAPTLPADLVEASSVLGDPAEAVSGLAAYAEAGADELILHGGTIHELQRMAGALTGTADGR
jgi:5,10-methylenetetrahydromethanopterin reductase